MKWMVKKSGVNLAAYTRLLVINGELRFCFIKFAYHNYYLVFFYNHTLSLGIIKLNISIFSSFHSISEWKLYFFPATISCIVIILGWPADWLTDWNRWYASRKFSCILEIHTIIISDMSFCGKYRHGKTSLLQPSPKNRQ